MEPSLREKVLNSLTWVGSVNLISQIASWAITIVIVRQLSPGDFGLMAMAMAFWGFLIMISDFGFFSAIVQSKEVLKNELREIFGFIFILNILFFIATYLSAPMISIYFSQPRLAPLLRILAISFLFVPIFGIPQSLLCREMKFKKISIIDGCCNLSGGIISLFFALGGFGVWSLVYGILVQHLAKAVFYSLAEKFFLIPLFRVNLIKGIFSFSGCLAGSDILRYIYFKLDVILGGRFIGPEALGIYSIANQLAFMPVDKLSMIIPQVAFPAFSKMQYDIAQLSANFLKGLKLLNLIFIPCYIIVFVLSNEIIILLLGSKWENIISPLRILCVIMPLRAIEMLFLPAMNALGKSKISLVTNGLSLIIMACAFWVGLNWGYMGLCWAWVGGYSIIYMVIANVITRNLKLNRVDLARTFKTAIISSSGLLIMGVLMSINTRIVINPAGKIAAFLAMAIFLYLASIILVDRPFYVSLKNIWKAKRFG